MARAKKMSYEYVESLGVYRKRVQDGAGKYVAVCAKTPEKLEEKLSKFEKYKNLSETGKQNILVNDYIQQWLDMQSINQPYQVQVNQQSTFNCHISPILSGIRMLDVKPKHIKQVMLGVSNKSESKFKATFLILSQVFRSAYENRDIPENPCPKMPDGGIPPEERIALTQAQVAVLLDAVKGHRVYPFCMIALYSGLRREEILALQWNCVRLEGVPSITVKRALRFEHNQPVVSEKLKTKAAKRIVPIPPVLVACLKEEHEKSHSDYVISNSQGGPLSQTQFKSLWHGVVCRTTKERVYKKYVNGTCIVRTICPVKGEKAKHHTHNFTIDFEVTPHILRHTYISNLILGGTDIKSVQYLAGHEKSQITLDIYTHLIYNRPEDIIEKVRKAFGNPTKQTEENHGSPEKAKI